METMTFEKLIEKIKTYNECEVGYITNVYNFANKLHEGQMRQSGEPYISHPLAVAYILAEMKADRDTLCAGLLHDIVEDTETTVEDIEKLFNKDIATLVGGVTKIGKINFQSKKERNNANTRKIITGITKDVRIIIIKLADRLHNMRTLEFKSPEKQVENSLETMEIFVPIANYIGAYRIKCELEDIAFKYLKPEEFKRLSEETQIIENKSQECIEEMIYEIKELLTNEEIPVEIKKRTNNIYGIYKSLLENKRMVDIHDLIALKVMVEEVKDCYYALGLIHSKYQPLVSKFKDYICRPKTNMYQSLHTTVFAKDETLIQTQIRTFEMDKIASFGLTAYWDLNKGKACGIMQKDLNNKFQFYKVLEDINKLAVDNEEFVTTVKNEVFNDNIYIYTSNGLIIELPNGSTPIDYAYKIEYGKNAAAFMVNGKLVPFNYKLKNNDIVKIIEGQINLENETNIDSIATTMKAKENIKQIIKHKGN